MEVNENLDKVPQIPVKTAINIGRPRWLTRGVILALLAGAVATAVLVPVLINSLEKSSKNSWILFISIDIQSDLICFQRAQPAHQYYI
jgi:hypothetical protein